MQLGFPSGALTSYGSTAFEPVLANSFSYFNVACLGDETSLDDCPHADVGACNKLIGVICNTTISEGKKLA